MTLGVTEVLSNDTANHRHHHDHHLDMTLDVTEVLSNDTDIETNSKQTNKQQTNKQQTNKQTKKCWVRVCRPPNFNELKTSGIQLVNCLFTLTSLLVDFVR